jgi:hypothetical protein
MAEPINIDQQFENYLSRMKLDKSKLNQVQYDEMKKSFFAGASAMLMLFRIEIPDLPEDKAMVAMEKLWQEAQFFWKINLM